MGELVQLAFGDGHRCTSPLSEKIDFVYVFVFLASQDALEVMFVSE